MKQEEEQSENAACNAAYQAGVASRQAGRYDEAANIFGAMLIKGWAIDYVLCELGVIAFKTGEYDRAERLLGASLGVNPRSASTMTNLAASYRLAGRNAEAIHWCNAALALDDNNASAYNNKGSALFELLDYEGALAAFNEAVIRDSSFSEAVGNRGEALTCLGRYNEGERDFIEALRLNPANANAEFNYSKLLLKTGRLREGFARYERRWEASMRGMQRHSQIRPWLGEESLAGCRILVYHEQGFGDAIQFARFIAPLKERGCEIVFEVDKALIPVMSPLERYARLAGKDTLIERFDFLCPLLSLPFALKVDFDTIPADCQISVPMDRAIQWASAFGDSRRPKIGVAWSGQPKFWMDEQRSLKLNELPRFDDRYEVVSLQREVRECDVDELRDRGYAHFGERLNDFGDTAAVVDQMDLVISADTGVAHLAASLGKKVWLLLPTNSDWRWFTDRLDSPWYPAIRIFRLKPGHEWASLKPDIEMALAEEFP